jgi:GTP cyclohydrolase I
VDANRIESLVTQLLDALGEDTKRPGLDKTPSRVAELYAELYRGVGVDPAAVIASAPPLDSDQDERGDLVALRGIDFTSICEHHLLPFRGSADVVYRPGTRLLGLGVLAELVQVSAARPQIQERLGDMVVHALVESGVAQGAMAVLRAEHGCVAHRGPKLQGSETVTVAAGGSLAEEPDYSHALLLVGGVE